MSATGDRQSRAAQNVDADQQRNIILNRIFSALENITVNGGPGAAAPYRIVTADDDFDPADYLILVDASGGPVTLTLLDAASVNGRTFVAVKIDASGNPVSVVPQGADTIRGFASVSTILQWAGWQMFSAPPTGGYATL